VIIREARSGDVAAITALYNATIPTTTSAWTESVQTESERQEWFEHQHGAGFPVLVADADGDVVGYAAYEHFRGAGKWPGYRFTVEHSVHVAEAHWGSGVGRSLIEHLVDHARAAGLHVMVAAIDGANTGSIEFHRRLGFIEVARMPETGHKFGRWLDLVLMQRILDT
jgi:L-amino acid N-acyltransferase YncA